MEQKKGAFELTVPLDREGKKATFQLKDMDEHVFMAARKLYDTGKDFDAVRLMVKALHVGGDDPKLLDENFIATNAAAKQIKSLIEPLDGELKKN